MVEERREDSLKAKQAAPGADAAPFPDGPPPLPPPEKPARRRWRGAFLAGLVVGLAVAGAGAYFGGQAWLAGTYLPRLAAVEKRAQALEAAQATLAAQPAPSAPAVAPEVVDALGARVAAIESAVAALDEAPAPPVPDAGLEARIAALEARLDEAAAAQPSAATPSAVLVPATPMPDTAALERRLAALESKAGGGTSAADVARFQARTEEAAATAIAAADAGKALALRVEALEGVVGERGTAALIIVLAQLRQGLIADAPYATTLAVARRLAQARPEVDVLLADLEANAAVGAPSREALAAAFPAIVDAVLATQPPDDAPWYDRALARLQGIVTVRRIGADVQGDGPEARVARAEAALGAGDLAAAVAEMEPLFSEPAVGPWLAGAQARLAQDAAAARLAEAVVALAGGAG